MVRLIEELSLMEAPIIFKGAVVLKTAVLSGCNLNTERVTKDLDGDWVGGVTSMAMLTAIIDRAAKNIDPNFHVESYRKFEEKKSAGFTVYNHNDEIFTFDLSVKSNPFYTVYVSDNGVNFNGATPVKMVSDKIQGISNRTIFRRSKDLYDLYLLSSLSGYTTYEIFDIWRVMNRELGEFIAFCNHRQEVEKAYNKLKDITNKPNFPRVYNRVYRFVFPFMNNITDRDYVWDGNQWC